MSRIQFTKDETAAITAAIRRYFREELDQDLGDLPAQMLLDYFGDKVGAYFYNRGVYDAQALVARKAEDISEALYALERKPG